jgi:hypothetical protein
MLALIAAALPLLGSETISVGPTSTNGITLTLSPPQGATQYRLKWTFLSAAFTHAYENTSTTPCSGSTDLQYGYTIRDNGVQVYMERIYPQVETYNFTAYDGLPDFAGTSGQVWTSNKTKVGAYSGWISGVPATVTAGYRADHSPYCGNGIAFNGMTYSATLLVEYQ